MRAKIAPTGVTDVTEGTTVLVDKPWDLDRSGTGAAKPLPEDNTSCQTYLDAVNFESSSYG